MSIVLSEQQELIVQKFIHNKDNLFICGRAGTGKSVVLRALVARSVGYGIVCAPTGVAAINVGGCTVHKLIVQLHRGKQNPKSPLQYVIIDEVSMVRADLLDKLDAALKHHTGNMFKPFGGVRLVIIGDPGQLPPVVKDGADKEYLDDNYHSPYFFSAASYAKASWDRIELDTIFRQQGDMTYIKLLNLIRDGEKEKSLKALECCVTDEPEGIVLCTTNRAAEEINNIYLNELDTPTMTFNARARGAIQEYEYPAPGKLDLKVGARVMVIKNIYDGDGELELVNGDWCEVAALRESSTEQDSMTGESKPVPTQILVTCERTGQVHNIDLHNWDKEEAVYDPKVKNICKTVVASFVQYPLRLAWAVTIHKSQGATFDKFTIDMRRPMFAAGQLYVALSRGVDLSGLNIIGKVRKRDVIVCPIISKFLTDFSTGVGIKSKSKYDHADDTADLQRKSFAN